MGGRGRSASGACISFLWRASHRFHIGVLENLHIAKRTAGEGEHVEAKVFCDSPFEWVEGDATAHAEELHGRAADHKGQAGSHKKGTSGAQAECSQGSLAVLYERTRVVYLHAEGTHEELEQGD